MIEIMIEIIMNIIGVIAIIAMITNKKLREYDNDYRNNNTDTFTNAINKFKII